MSSIELNGPPSVSPDDLQTRNNSIPAAADATPPTGRGFLRQAGDLVWDIVRERCPRCREGRIFRGRFTMNDPCPKCGLIFQREEGSFLGAMYVSYALACAFLIPAFIVVRLLFPSLSTIVVYYIAVAFYLPVVPAVFRYSRVIWIYFERAGRSADIPAGLYEKQKLRQLADARPEDLPN